MIQTAAQIRLNVWQTYKMSQNDTLKTSFDQSHRRFKNNEKISKND